MTLSAFQNLQIGEHCVCNHGYIGESCSLAALNSEDTNMWFKVSSSSSVFSPRVAHSVIYVDDTDTLLAFGGLHFSLPLLQGTQLLLWGCDYSLKLFSIDCSNCWSRSLL